MHIARYLSTLYPDTVAAVTVHGAEEMGEAVSELLGDPARLEAMREAGRRLAGAQVGRTEALAEELLGMLR